MRAEKPIFSFSKKLGTNWVPFGFHRYEHIPKVTNSYERVKPQTSTAVGIYQQIQTVA